MVVIDVAHIFRVFDGPHGLLAMLDKHVSNHGLSYNTVQMWNHRQQIPAKWVGAAIYCCEQEGHDCREFLTDNDEFVAR